MIESDKTEFFSRLNGLMEIFGKPKITAAAAQIWWDTVRNLDHNDAFTVLGYWAQNNHKPPAPADVWRIANDARTNRLEEKAAQERSSNRGMVAHDFRPTETGRRALKACIEVLKNKPRPEGRYNWARRIVAMHERGDDVPHITVQIARKRLSEIDPNRIDL